jgi:hypothetical protein
MIAQEFVILEFGVVKGVLTKDNARVGRGSSPSANSLYHSLTHVFRVTMTFESLERRPVAAVGGVAQHQYIPRTLVIWKKKSKQDEYMQAINISK